MTPKPKKIEKIYFGENGRGQFIVDEDTRKGKYTQQDKIAQLIYKLNELVEAVNYLLEREK